MTTLAVPYYGKLYHDTTGYERVFFIVDYDPDLERAADIRLRVWDPNQTPDLYDWLKENGVLSIVCRDPGSLPILERVASRGIPVMEQSCRCAKSVMSNLYL